MSLWSKEPAVTKLACSTNPYPSLAIVLFFVFTGMLMATH